MLARASRKVQALVIVGIVLITMRFAIPPALEFYVTTVLNDLPGCSARVGKLNVHFLKAGYSLDSVTLYRLSDRAVFVSVSSVDINLQWESLLHGRVVTKIALHKPTVNFAAHKVASKVISQGSTDWSRTFHKLAIFPVNQLSVKGGTLSFSDLNRTRGVEVYLRNIDIESQNLLSVTNSSEALPSRIFAKAQSSGNGSLSLAMKLNTLKAFPDLDLDLKLENVNMHALRDFLFAYASIDVVQGKFHLYSEVTVTDGKIDGYVKPKLDNVMLSEPQPARLIMGKIQQPGLTESGVGPFRSHVPLAAIVDQPNSDFWPLLWNLFRNASMKGFEQNTRHAGYLAAGNETL